MKIEEVTSTEQKREFIQLPVRLYKTTPQWIRPLDKDIEAVFDPKKNKAFRKDGVCCRWLLKDDTGQTIGRVAAFINRSTVHKGNDQPTGGMGFFECVNHQEAAFMLLDQCKNWLEARGMEAMDGPINFGNRDRWWGLLIEGADLEPNYQLNYHFGYYKDFFEAYGFQVYFNQLTFGRSIMGAFQEKLVRKAEMMKDQPDYHFAYLRKKDWGTLAEKIRYVYNKAWASRNEIPELTMAQAKFLVKQLKPLLDEKLLWFGYYKGEPIAFFLSIPEVNQIFKYVNGKLNWLGKIKFVWYKWRQKNKKVLALLFGISPEHQGKGVDGGIIEGFRAMVQAKDAPYEYIELNWIGDFNPRMIQMVKQINTVVIKKHATMRKLFDPTKPFKRMSIVNK